MLKVSEVARLLSVSEYTVRRWTREKLLTVFRTPTGRWLYKREDVEKLIPKEAAPAQ
ncbi:MAG: helix-turn-helix domain-containing protein [Candidatus Brocadiales bacterium]|nr:helix-turn-helix domain-containing protein [Candidatus Brocadiales bacterium]